MDCKKKNTEEFVKRFDSPVKRKSGETEENAEVVELRRQLNAMKSIVMDLKKTYSPEKKKRTECTSDTSNDINHNAYKTVAKRKKIKKLTTAEKKKLKKRKKDDEKYEEKNKTKKGNTKIIHETDEEVSQTESEDESMFKNVVATRKKIKPKKYEKPTNRKHRSEIIKKGKESPTGKEKRNKNGTFTNLTKIEFNRRKYARNCVT